MEAVPKPDLDEVYPQIFVGSKHAAAKLELLQSLNIKYILNCTQTVEFSFPDEIKYMRISILD